MEQTLAERSGESHASTPACLHCAAQTEKKETGVDMLLVRNCSSFTGRYADGDRVGYLIIRAGMRRSRVYDWFQESTCTYLLH